MEQHNSLYHDIKVSPMRDMRKNQRPEVADDEIFYIVQRVHVGNATWFHHASIICDTVDCLSHGISQLKDGIASELGNVFRGEIEPVFIRSLAYCNPDIVDALENMGIRREQEELLESSVFENYVVMGLIGEKELSLMVLAADCAQDASELANDSVLKQHGKRFMPLNICLVSSIIPELDRIFQRTAANMQLLLAMPVAASH